MRKRTGIPVRQRGVYGAHRSNFLVRQRAKVILGMTTGAPRRAVLGLIVSQESSHTFRNWLPSLSTSRILEQFSAGCSSNVRASDTLDSGAVTSLLPFLHWNVAAGSSTAAPAYRRYLLDSADRAVEHLLPCGNSPGGTCPACRSRVARTGGSHVAVTWRTPDASRPRPLRASVYPPRWHRCAQARFPSRQRWGRPDARKLSHLDASVAITDARKPNRPCDRFDCATTKSVDARDDRSSSTCARGSRVSQPCSVCWPLSSPGMVSRLGSGLSVQLGG